MMKGKFKENHVSPRATRSMKNKHFVSRFVDEGKLGSVRKSSLAELRTNLCEIEMEKDSTFKVRPLGPLRSLGTPASQESLLSGETYFVEAHQAESELTLLQQALRKQESHSAAKQVSITQLNSQVSVLTKELATVTKELATVLKELATVKAQVDLLTSDKALLEEDKFSTVGMQMSIRSFIDHILSTVYKRAGLVGINEKTGLVYSDYDVADWLGGPEAPLLFQGGNFITVFGVEVAMEASLLTLLRSCRSISSTISRKYAHSSEPVLVAAALNNLQYKEDHDLGKLFKIIFQHSFTDMVKKHETGRLTIEKTARFSKRFFSRT